MPGRLNQTIMEKLTLFSYGGGQDSFAILLKLIFEPAFRKQYAPGRLIVAMSDTGAEHPETYSHLESVVIPLCEEYGIEFTLITPALGFHSIHWENLFKQYEQKQSIGSAAFRQTCTDNLKVRVVDRFFAARLSELNGAPAFGKSSVYKWVEANGKIDLILGFGADEKTRGAASMDPLWKKRCLTRVYPLVDIGYTRQHCQTFIQDLKFDLPQPSNCIICFYMSLHELLWLSRQYPEVFEWWRLLEARKLEHNKSKGAKNLGVYGKKTLAERLETAIERHGHLSDEDLMEYKMSHGHCAKSKF